MPGTAAKTLVGAGHPQVLWVNRITLFPSFCLERGGGVVLCFSYSINNYFQEEITKKVHQKFYRCSWDSFSMHESSSTCQGCYVPGFIVLCIRKPTTF